MNIVVYIIREGILRLRCIRLRMTVESTHRTLKLFDFFVSCVCCDIVHSIALFLNHPTMPPKKSSSHPRIRIISIGGQGALIIDRLYHLASRTIELVSIGLPSALVHAPHITTKIELPYMSLVSNDPVAGARSHRRPETDTCEHIASNTETSPQSADRAAVSIPAAR